jgi:hypothetical protein
VQLRLLGGLAALAPGLGTPARCQLTMDLMVAWHRAADDAVRTTIAKLIAELRAVNEGRHGAAEGDQGRAYALLTALSPQLPEKTRAERDEAPPTS